MMKIALLVAIVLQIILAVASEGLTRSLAELGAFVLTVVFVVTIKKAKPSSGSASKLSS